MLCYAREHVSFGPLLKNGLFLGGKTDSWGVIYDASNAKISLKTSFFVCLNKKGVSISKRKKISLRRLTDVTFHLLLILDAAESEAWCGTKLKFFSRSILLFPYTAELTLLSFIANRGKTHKCFMM